MCFFQPCLERVLFVHKAASDQGHKVEDGRGVVLAPTQAADVQVVMPLAQLAPVRVEDEGQVAEPWRRPTKGAIQKDVLGRGDLPFNAAQYLTRYQTL